MISDQAIVNQLKQVLDPELGINIVDLGLVYAIESKDQNLAITLTLTTPGCPLINEFVNSVRLAISHLDGVGEVTINLTFDPPWTPARMTPEAAEELGLIL